MVLMERHFTATTFVLHPKENKVLLHWHKKVKTWLPPGGHIEKNETPIEAALRETFEETGLNVEFLDYDLERKNRNFDNVEEITPPYTILLEKINDPKNGEHIHIDMIYFSKALNTQNLKFGWFWADENELKGNVNLNSNIEEIQDDVRVLGLKCIELRRKYGY